MNHHVGPVGILWVIQKTANVVNKQWVKQISDFLLVSKIKGSLVWDPELISLVIKRRVDFKLTIHPSNA
jgi:hypothetical protein